MLKRQWKLTLIGFVGVEEERKSLKLQKRIPQELLELI